VNAEEPLALSLMIEPIVALVPERSAERSAIEASIPKATAPSP
jgi:hypothetical protein